MGGMAIAASPQALRSLWESFGEAVPVWVVMFARLLNLEVVRLGSPCQIAFRRSSQCAAASDGWATCTAQCVLFFVARSLWLRPASAAWGFCDDGLLSLLCN